MAEVARHERHVSMNGSRSAVREAELPHQDWSRLRHLPWDTSLTEWPERGVPTLSVRRGESRHEVIFVRGGTRRYASKRRVPRLPSTKSAVLRELAGRGCRTLEPVGFVVTHGEPVAVGEIGGRTAYMSGDTGYCITRLAERVLPAVDPLPLSLQRREQAAALERGRRAAARSARERAATGAIPRWRMC